MVMHGQVEPWPRLGQHAMTSMILSAAGSSLSMCVGEFHGSPSIPSPSHRPLSPDDTSALFEKVMQGLNETDRQSMDLVAGLLDPIHQYVDNRELADCLAKREEEMFGATGGASPLRMPVKPTSSFSHDVNWDLLTQQQQQYDDEHHDCDVLMEALTSKPDVQA